MATSAGDTEELSGDSEEHSEKRRSIVINGTNDMICASCFSRGVETGAVGICKECKFYLCRSCVSAHRRKEEFKNHVIAFFYCAQKLKVNKLVKAHSFCLDCGQYLCKKCVLDHGGFWQYRHHSFIGGKSDPNDEKSDDEFGANLTKRPLTRSTARTATSLRRLDSRRSRKTDSSSNSKSSHNTPTDSLAVSIPGKRQQTLHIDESVVFHRTLLHSTTGRKPITSKPSQLKTKTRIHNNKPKTVRYKAEHIGTASLVGEYGMMEPEDEKSCRIVAAMFLANDKIVIADYNNKKLKLFDRHFILRSSLPIEKFPVAICSSRIDTSGCYASSGNQIFQIATNINIVIVQTLHTDISKIEGLTSWADGIAAMFKSTRSRYDKRGHWEIHLIDYKGVVKFQIVISSQCVVKLETPIWYIGSTNEGNEIFISDTHNNRIVCVDITEWHVVYVLKGNDPSGAPRCLATDAEGNVLVTWYDEVHKIQSQTGIDIGVPVKKIGKNSVIAYNQRTDCLVVYPEQRTGSDKFKVYQLNG